MPSTLACCVFLTPACCFRFEGTAGITGNCDVNRAGPAATITGYTTVSSSAAGETTSMASYMASTGPMSICVDAETGWQTYTSGVLTKCGDSVDHCVQVQPTYFTTNFPKYLCAVYAFRVY